MVHLTAPPVRLERRSPSRVNDDPMRGEAPSVIRCLERIRGEYLEMPGLSLTEQQAERLWGFDPTVCQALLDALAQSGFLRRTANGTYVRGEDV
jgi:hypothetical protein